MGKAFLDAFDAPDELNELKDYLGGEYDESVLSRYEQVVDDEEHSAPDEATFYRTSKYYLYNLTVFAMSGTKRPYRAAIRRQVGPGARLLDYGCGIGADGLRFGDAGYRVDFADFANPSVEYLRWRLGRRDRAARIFDVENPSDVEAMSSDRHDLVYCFDVIEHIDDPFAFLAKLESVGDYVAVNFLEPDPDDVHVHKPLPIRELMAHASAKGIVHYAFHYDRSHFVIYRSRPSSGLRAVAGRARVAWSRRAQTGIPAHLS